MAHCDLQMVGKHSFVLKNLEKNIKILVFTFVGYNIKDSLIYSLVYNDFVCFT